MGAGARTGQAGSVAALLLLVLFASTPASAHGESGPCPLDVMIVLDRSGSMDGAPGAAARAGAATLLSALGDSDTSGLRGFAQTLKDKGLDGDHAATIEAVDEDAPPAGFGTQYSATEDALADIRADGRPYAEWVMVVLSDGVNADTSPVASQAKAAGVRVFSVAIGAYADDAHMQAVASEPKDLFYYQAADEKETNRAMQAIHTLLMDCRLEPEMELLPGCIGRPARMSLDFSTNPLATPRTAHWTFSDGHPPMNTSAQEPAERDLHGPVTVTVHVTDQRGRVVHMKAIAAPEDCVPPEAVVVCQTAAAMPQQVQVAAKVKAGDAPVASFAWEVDGMVVSTAQTFLHTLPDTGPHTFRVTVVDENGQWDSAEGRCAAPGQDPPLLHVSDLVVHEGVLARQSFYPKDPNDDDLELSWRSAAIPEATGDADFQWQTAVGDAGTHGPVVVTVTDGHFEVNASFWVTVVPYDPRAAPDEDQDGVADHADNCPGLPNRDQADRDADGRGDACQGLPASAGQPADADGATDVDLDGIDDHADNCVAVPNPMQRDMDRDGEGDACDADADGDRIADLEDNCIGVPNPDQSDADRDGVGDACKEPATPGQPARTGPVQEVPTQRLREPSAAILGGLVLVGTAGAGGGILLATLLLRARK